MFVSTLVLRAANAARSGGATNSATVEVAATRMRAGAPWACRITDSPSAARATISDAILTNRAPPGVRDIPAAVLVISGSLNCWRRAANAPETAGSVTPNAPAAAFTDPRRATSTNASNWVRVTRQGLPRPVRPG